MTMRMNDTAFLKKAEVVGRLLEKLPRGSVLYDSEDLRPWECDGLAAYRMVPGVVALPADEDEVRHVL